MTEGIHVMNEKYDLIISNLIIAALGSVLISSL